jgi:hypothetical protein
MKTQTEAKRFFIDKVLQQAARESMSLSENERAMLLWSEDDPDLDIDPDLPDKLDAEISQEDYEAKIAGLLKRAWGADTAAESRAVWQAAYKLLNQGDHYIQVMIDMEIGRSLGKWKLL